MQTLLIGLRELLLKPLTAGQPQNVLNPPVENAASLPAHQRLDEVLYRLLNRLIGEAISPDGSRVNYEQMRASRSFQDEFLVLAAALREFEPAQLRATAEKLAFWINLYNVLVIHGVIALGIRRSVSERWAGLAFFRQAAYCVGGQRLTLDDIEHGILRSNRGHPFLPGAQFADDDPRLGWALPHTDARIHFALNCASHSCPPIGVYHPARMDQQLNLAAAHFVDQDVEVAEENSLRLSSIFRWYQSDFGGKQGILDFLLRYLPEHDSRRRVVETRRRSLRLIYRPYDWKLNRM